jgi:hypothetical protein
LDSENAASMSGADELERMLWRLRRAAPHSMAAIKCLEVDNMRCVWQEEGGNEDDGDYRNEQLLPDLAATAASGLPALEVGVRVGRSADCTHGVHTTYCMG